MTKYFLTGTDNWPGTREGAIQSLEANGYKPTEHKDRFSKKNGDLVVVKGDKFPELRIDYLAQAPRQPGQVEYVL